MSKRSDEFASLACSRRDIMRGIALAGIGLSATAPVWSSLAAAQDSKLAPRRGGILTLNLTSDPANFDPMSTATNRVLYIAGACYNNLVMFDPMRPDAIVGDLARDWTVSKDALTYTFSLIDGVRFHDGMPFTAEDVKYTFDFLRNPPEGAVSVRSDQLEMIDTIQVVDALTVRMVLKRPSPAFLPTLASGWMLIYPKHILEDKGSMKDDVVGTGPFRLAKYTKGVSIELVRNEHYHVPDRPYLDGITIYVISDAATTLSYLKTGQLTVFMNMGDEEARRTKLNDKELVVQEVPALSFTCVSFNTTKGPFSDIRVRQAVSLVMDRAETIAVVGQGEAVTGGLMPPGRWAVPPGDLSKVPGYGGDPKDNLAKAQKLMHEAGVPDGFTTTLMTKRNANYEAVAVFMQSKLATIGIKSSIDLQDDTLSYDNLVKKNYEISPWVHTAGGDDPDTIFSDFYTCKASRNYSGICDGKFDESFARQSQEMDETKRRAISQEMELAMLNQFNRVVLFWQKKFLGLSPRVQGLIIHPVMDNNRRFQNVWLSA
ncbi:ABC transporter substrate-binding protein [Ensifer sp. YR511]|uniref:ABC transporter substrate-binding protein n=1 Tax=Ensifer sp. YR511 TaxID=1855294 RepID=UPI0008818958|nr:ABC transporter substrate-binding protein [Ensifer sp. YR511]SDO04845.1 peptide/nickel transport system substrate-binding protein [Ensifer sp. YR511]